MRFKYHVSAMGREGNLILNAMAHDNEVYGLVPTDVDVYLIGPVVAYPVFLGTDHRGPGELTRDCYSFKTRYLARWIGWPRARRLRDLLAG